MCCSPLCPLVDFRPGFDAEACGIYLEIPELRGLEKKAMPPEQWRDLLLQLVREVQQWGGRGFPSQADTLVMTGLSLQGYPQARQYLIDHGRSAAAVEAMPVAQVILLYTVNVYDELRDEQFKWLFLPYGEAYKGLELADRSLKEAIVKRREIIPVASLLLPAVRACKQAETRLDWILARLRILEALRQFAATHGRLPDRLGDVTEAPIPANPFDGRPFSYRRDGDKAELGCETGPLGQLWKFEITFVK